MAIREARQSLSHLYEILTAEGEVAITKRGREIALVLPFGRVLPMPSHQDLRGKMPLMMKGSEDLVREDRDARSDDVEVYLQQHGPVAISDLTIRF